MEEQSTKRECVCMGIAPEVINLLKKLGPSDSVMDHFRNARIEVLKGVRQILDNRIEHLSRTEKKGTRVTVE